MTCVVTQDTPNAGGDKAHENLLPLVRRNYSIVLMARMFGYHEQTVRRVVREICVKHGLTHTPEEGGRGNHISATTPETYRLRVNLHNWVVAYREHWPMRLTDRQIATTTGMTSRGVKRVENRPHDHDWSISQIARLATAVGMTVEQLLLDCVTRNSSSLQLPQLKDFSPIHPTQLDQSIGSV